MRRTCFLMAYLLVLATATPSLAEPLAISAKPITQFLPDSNQTKFGKLEFLGGLELTSDHEQFGGISGARYDADGRLVMLTDKARVIIADLIRKDNKPAKLEHASVTRLKAANGKTITGAQDKDSESLEIIGSDYFVGFERNDRLLRFRRSGSTFTADQQYMVDFTPEVFPNNRGAEALAYRQQTKQLIVITEMAMDENGNHKGYVISDGAIKRKLTIKNRDGFSPTDAAFLPDGSLLLLERYYSPLTGVFMQIRRIAADTLDKTTPLDGEILIEANRHFQIDNMEALALSNLPDGSIRLTMLSDDNFSDNQRTLLLEFRLAN